MASLTLRSNNSAGLTNTQIDNNFTSLNTDSLVQVNTAIPWKASTAVTVGQVLYVLESVATAGSEQSVTGGTLIVGKTYVIVSVGTTSFTTWGATTQAVGTVFTATGAGSGTGTVKLVVRFYEVTVAGTTGGSGTAPNHISGTITNGTANLTFVSDPPVYLVNSKITGTSTTATVFNTFATTGQLFGAATTVSIGASTGTTTVNNNLTVTGDLTVIGTTTTVNSTTITVDDKNIELGSVASPTDTTADGGGITLKGTTDKTFNWVNSTTSWTSSENINLAAGKGFKVGGNTILTATTLDAVTVDGGTY